ncbi:MAG: VWA domain-containing protein [Bacteroidetes bacterium]|nr:MAG: VWA domain-containing protein [Bacteroidota bacterium]
MLRFAFPEYWYWWLGLPVSLGILYLVYRRGASMTYSWFSPDQYERSRPLAKMALRAGGLLCLLLALVGPYLGSKESPVTLASRDIYILLDVSASMNTEDLRPSRLERAKQALKSLITDFQGDRLGLILFTDQPYVQCPLTRDHETVSLFLDMAETAQYSQRGTQFRPALAVALDRFSQEADPAVDVSRAVILVSDGEDFGDSYASLIERLRQAQVRVFPVGVGTYEGGPVPVLQQGRRAGFRRYEDGSTVVSRLVDEDLQQIASQFDTEYVHLGHDDSSLGLLRDQIYALTATPWETRLEQVERNTYQLFLFLAVVMLLGSLFLMPIRKV